MVQRFESRQVKVTVMVSGLNVRNSFQKVYHLTKIEVEAHNKMYKSNKDKGVMKVFQKQRSKCFWRLNSDLFSFVNVKIQSRHFNF